MSKATVDNIIDDLKSYIINTAQENNLTWFYNLHQKEVIDAAYKLLDIFKNADRDTVIISCWLHDVSKFHTNLKNEDHHIDSAKIASDLLSKYDLPSTEIDSIINCILRHRNSDEYKASSLEEKIVVVADTLSHFANVFYMTYFKFHPEKTIDDMVNDDLEKIERDWRDLDLLPESKVIAKKEYELFKNLLLRYMDKTAK